MCGIAGIFNLRDRDVPGTDLVSRMTEAFAYRGPDDEGTHAGAGIALGVRRLAIMDPAHGKQPMFTGEGRVVCVCNGEIYNHAKLRRQLAGTHRFLTGCDVEVLAPLYLALGPDFTRRLRGQFALAIYDAHEHRLVLARDPMGIAPLFYTEVDGQLIFASEIKGLLQHPDVPRRVDLEGLDQVMTFPGPVSPRTLFEGIRSLPPGFSLIAEGGGIRTAPYWDLPFPRSSDVASPPLEAAAEELERLLLISVERRLQADVPIGFYVSGGLDSALIAGMVRKLTGDIHDSFSVRFSDDALDEGAHQRLVVDHVGSRHHEVTFDAAACGMDLRRAVFHAEAPLKESYDTCSMALSGKVHDTGLKVILSGEGADELLGGYAGYGLDELRTSVAVPELEELLEQELRQRLWGATDFVYERNYASHRDTRLALYSESLRSRFDGFDCTRGPMFDTARLGAMHSFHRRSYLDCKLRLADHLLADHGDRAAYANSVEARFPYLDTDVVSFVASLSPSLFLRDDGEKALLRIVAGKYVPNAIARRSKFAFVAPASPSILRDSDKTIRALLDPELIRKQGYFDPATVERLCRRQRDSPVPLTTTFEEDWLMIVLTFGMLLDVFGLPDLS